MALDELLDGDRLDALAAEPAERRVELGAVSSTRTVSSAPAPVRGLRMIGNPTWSREAVHLASDVSAAVDAAVGTPAARSASFIDGLSRHSQAVRTEVPGIVHASRTCAAASVCASIVDSRRSTHTLSCTQRTASVSTPASTTVGTWW